MKSTGMIRPVDQFGRVVLPIELRKTMEIEHNTMLEIFVDGPKIILQKYQPVAQVVSEKEGLLTYALILAARAAGKDPSEYIDQARGERNG